MAKYTLAENIQRVKQSLQERFEAGKQALRKDLFGSRTNWSYFNYRGANSDILNQLNYEDTSNGTDFSCMFYECSSLTEIPELDTSNGTNFSNMFYSCSALTEIPELDFSKGTGFYGTFCGCKKLVSLPKIKFGEGTLMQTFSGCTALKTIEEIDFSNVTDTSNAFNSCPELTTMNVVGETKVNINLQWSYSLNVASLISLIKSLKDYSGTAEALTKTLTLSNDSWNVLANSSEAADELGYDWNMITCAQDVITSKGWNWA